MAATVTEELTIWIDEVLDLFDIVLATIERAPVWMLNGLWPPAPSPADRTSPPRCFMVSAAVRLPVEPSDASAKRDAEDRPGGPSVSPLRSAHSAAAGIVDLSLWWNSHRWRPSGNRLRQASKRTPAGWLHMYTAAAVFRSA